MTGGPTQTSDFLFDHLWRGSTCIGPFYVPHTFKKRFFLAVLTLLLLLLPQSTTRHGTARYLSTVVRPSLARIGKKENADLATDHTISPPLSPCAPYVAIRKPTLTVEQVTNVDTRSRGRDPKRTRISRLSGRLQRQNSSQQILSPSGCSSHAIP